MGTSRLALPPTTSIQPSTTAAAVACWDECILERCGRSHRQQSSSNRQAACASAAWR